MLRQSSKNLRKGSQIDALTKSGMVLPTGGTEFINKGLNLKEKLFPCQSAER